jgi:hypothetical protein
VDVLSTAGPRLVPNVMPVSRTSWLAYFGAQVLYPIVAMQPLLLRIHQWEWTRILHEINFRQTRWRIQLNRADVALLYHSLVPLVYISTSTSSVAAFCVNRWIDPELVIHCCLYMWKMLKLFGWECY